MGTIYYYILDTLADWECGHVIAELCSGRYLKESVTRYEIVLCGRTLDTITTMGGLRLTPDCLLPDIDPRPEDLLLLPGADNWLSQEQGRVLEKIHEFVNNGVTVAAICGATLGLASAGVLDLRLHTSNDLAPLTQLCTAYHGEKFYLPLPAVTDLNLITASGVAPIEFAYHIFRRLQVMDLQTLEAWHTLFSTGKPEAFYALMQSLPHRSTDS